MFCQARDTAKQDKRSRACGDEHGSALADLMLVGTKDLNDLRRKGFGVGGVVVTL